MLKRLNPPRSVAYFLIVSAAVIYIVFWFTGRKLERKEITVSAGMYIADRIDTLTALPAFENLIRRMNPRLIIIDEAVSFSLDLVESLHSDSLPAWHDAVREQFQERLRRLDGDLRFEIRLLRPWRLDILEVRKRYVESQEPSDEFRRKRLQFEIIHDAANRFFSPDTLFNNPLLINSVPFGISRELERLVFVSLFDNDLLQGSYTEYHERLLRQIRKSLDESMARRILIFCNPLHRLWLEKNLASYSTGTPEETSERREQEKQ